MAINRVTGKGAYMLLGGNRLEVTSIKPTPTTEWAVATDSSDYDASENILFRSKEPGETYMEVDIEGNFDLNSTSANVFALIRDGKSAAGEIWSSATTRFASGTFNVESGSTTLTVPGAQMYTFAVKLSSQGGYTLGGG